ncbi:MAG: hypothetical protein IKJ43_04475 [Bacilli bacterium]|nr:hypothetical protein [Bacilli bacterium]
MKKILYIILIITIIFLGGCSNKKYDGKKFYIEDKYYSKNEFIKISNLSKVKNESYILFTYNSYCNLAKPCEETFREFMKKYDIAFLSIPYEDFKKTDLYQTVKYAPSIIIVKDGTIVSYLDANSDDDLDKYQDLEVFEKWIKKYIKTKKS